ncbi:MAG: tRNA (N(6)-L-threonylcarbamoyladenosine(37)-C(2))-methylthiotransferase MtaB [Spirochaetales bacterium]|nr:tRNA (N(6)-L-threonylcarbamoyladenosine(37)-C(2))-methylthiotransferase MtaB [Spirochaetales bacterium]
MTVAFYTLGCKLNQSETESIAASFQHNGFSVVGHSQLADIYIINTCTVTSKSDQKARRIVRLLDTAHPNAMIILTGCYAEVEQEKLRELFETKSFIAVIPQSRKSLLMELPQQVAGHADFSQLSRLEKYNLFQQIKKNLQQGNVFALNNSDYLFHSRAFLKIQDGCDGRCAYCRVPLARGKARSLEDTAIVERVQLLQQQGFREIVLTGVNITAYQHADVDFIGLLRKLLAVTRGVRYRVSSLEPEKITSRLAEVLSHERICPHFHIPVQSGSDSILQRMRRRYTVERLVEGTKLLRSIKPDAFFAADVIVGFPGETDEDFKATRKLLSQLEFSKLHVFPFSSRPGTDAVNLGGHIPEKTVTDRVKDLVQWSEKRKDEYLNQFAGRTTEVILEKEVNKKLWVGTSGESIRCRVDNIPGTAARKRALIKATISGVKEPCNGVFLSEG